MEGEKPKAVVIEGGSMAESLAQHQFRENAGDSPFCNELVNVCSSRFLPIRKANQGPLIGVLRPDRNSAENEVSLPHAISLDATRTLAMRNLAPCF